MADLDKVVIVGGGVGGLTAALALKRAGIDVEVHEKYPHPAGRATGFTLWSYAVQHLIDLGIEDPTRIGSPVEFTEIHNQSGKLIEQLPVGEVSRALGAPSCDVNRRELQIVATELLGDGVVHMGSEAVDVEQDGDTATVVLADGGRVAADLVIGADGAHAMSRDKVAPGAELDYVGVSGWGGILDGFEHDRLEPNRHVEIWGRNAKAGVADLGHGHVRWYVTHRSPSGHKDDAIDTDRILAVVDGWYELIRDAVAAADPAEIVTTEAWDMQPIAGWIDRRLVLLGDSAHLTSPFASMGGCMTIEDAVTLVDHLTSDAPLDAALAAYQADRKQRDEALVQKARHLSHLQLLDSPVMGWLRDEAFEHMGADRVRKLTEEMASGAGAR
jgi:FAD-dependent urate hydroxylase